MLRSLFSPRRLIILAVLSVIALCVWFFGPLLQFGEYEPFSTVTSRLLFGAFLLVFWLLWNLIALWRARQASKRILEGLAANQELAEIAPSQEEEELQALREKMVAAIAAQKEALGKKRIFTRCLGIL